MGVVGVAGAEVAKPLLILGVCEWGLQGLREKRDEESDGCDMGPRLHAVVGKACGWLEGVAVCEVAFKAAAERTVYDTGEGMRVMGLVRETVLDSCWQMSRNMVWGDVNSELAVLGCVG